MWFNYTLIGCFGIWLCWWGATTPGSAEFPGSAILLMGAVFCFAAAYGFVWDYRNIHSVIMDEEKIVVSKLGTFYWADLEDINMHARATVRGYHKAIVLTFKSERTISLLAGAYSNFDEMRRYMEAHVISQVKAKTA